MTTNIKQIPAVISMPTPTKERRFSNAQVIPPIHRESSETNSETAPADDFSYSSKLTNVESQRIMAVLQEIQRKCHLVGLIAYINNLMQEIRWINGLLQFLLGIAIILLKYYVRLNAGISNS